MLHPVHKWFSTCTAVPSPEAAAIAYTISLANHCRFCATVHDAVLCSTGHASSAAAIRARRYESISSASIRNAALWAFSGFGHPAPEWIAAAAEAHFANRVGNALGLTAAFPFIPRPLRPWFAQRTAGASLLRPSGITGAPAAVSPVVEQRIRTHTQAWHGEEPGPNRGWVENYLADLSRPDRAIARLALLTALASHQVDYLVRDAFRDAVPGPGDLAAVIRWSAHLGAQRVVRTPPSGVVIAAA